MTEKQVEGPERIWARHSYTTGAGHRFGDYYEKPINDGVEYVRADLLQQPTSERCVECQICGHEQKWLANDKTCHFPVPICSDDYHGTRFCGCKCVFPATEATQVDDSAPRADHPVEAADAEEVERLRGELDYANKACAVLNENVIRLSADLSDARANATKECRDIIEAKQAEWEKLGDFGTCQGYVRRIEGANEILAALTKKEGDNGPTAKGGGAP